MQSFADTYYQRRPDGTWGNELEAFRVINCADTTSGSTVAEDDAVVGGVHEAAPRLVPAGSTGSYSCTFFPAALDPRVEITGAGAGRSS